MLIVDLRFSPSASPSIKSLQHHSQLWLFSVHQYLLWCIVWYLFWLYFDKSQSQPGAKIASCECEGGCKGVTRSLTHQCMYHACVCVCVCVWWLTMISSVYVCVCWPDCDSPKYHSCVCLEQMSAKPQNCEMHLFCRFPHTHPVSWWLIQSNSAHMIRFGKTLRWLRVNSNLMRRKQLCPG